MSNAVAGFSKLSKEEKINWIAKEYFSNPQEAVSILKNYWNADEKLQKLHDEFIENTISNFYLPLGVAPNFLINGKYNSIPMAIEESSVVAAASKSAKFWSTRGGFKATVINTEKIGQVHFIFHGDKSKLEVFFTQIKNKFFANTESITKNMQKRGGGILDIVLNDKTNLLPNYFQLHATFDTKDSMGANFINSCLEQFAKTLKEEAQVHDLFSDEEKDIEVVMSILSNYVPNCIVRAEVSCPVEDLVEKHIPNPKAFAERFVRADHSEAVLTEFRKQLARDRVKTMAGGFSALGLLEMTRKRTRESLAHLLSEACPSCQGRGAVKTARSLCYDILREILREARAFNPREFRVVASPKVIELFLDEESAHLAGLSDFIGKPISLQSDGAMSQEQYDIVLL